MMSRFRVDLSTRVAPHFSPPDYMQPVDLSDDDRKADSHRIMMALPGKRQAMSNLEDPNFSN